METKERIGTIREWLESFGDRAKKNWSRSTGCV